MSYYGKWKKFKTSGAFRRRVVRNMTEIMKENATISTQGSFDKQQSVMPLVDEKCVSDLQLPSPEMEKIVPENYANDKEVQMNWLLELEEDEGGEDNCNETLSKDNNVQFLNNFRLWANTFNIRHRALKSIINVVNTRFPNILPKDPRTLLQTPPAKVVLQKMGEGYYWHQGFEVCLKNCFDKIRTYTSLSITLNIDGLPIYKSSKDEFWPILFNIFEIPHLHPMIIGIYSGKGKPPDIKTFITPFVEEMKLILEHGILFENGHHLKISIRCFVCDSPARSFIKGVANFNGQHGCLKCTTVGEYSYLTHCNVFPRIDCPKRTDEGFRLKMYGSHHKCATPLEELPINMIEDFPIADSLHLLDLGIMKRCLMGWRDGTFRNFNMKWSANDIYGVSQYLRGCRLPSEIHRAVRGLECLPHWKGLEYRSFLYYIGIVILKKYLPRDVYEHFLLLFCAVTICSSPRVH
ncbi:uncharacterized protein LOC116160111 [Photinus pyralis]|uniref:uncharacterized protein LOC116160111 n=1 Tax=Photinus pyralis TaxID=7054 RepID=UPI0012670D54|nr:uncharacterized protein LOC116160111 [Photinus pyralis]